MIAITVIVEGREGGFVFHPPKERPEGPPSSGALALSISTLVIEILFDEVSVCY